MQRIIQRTTRFFSRIAASGASLSMAALFLIVSINSIRRYAIGKSFEWGEAGLEGAMRFLKRLWTLVHEHVASGPASPLDVAALSEDATGPSASWGAASWLSG